MIYKIIKKINLKIILALFFLAILSSCEDYGCIEADDFGEYNLQNIEVYANNAEALCNRKKNLPYDNSIQPAGFRGCYVNDCSGMAKAEEKKSCAENCEIKCSKDPILFLNYTSSGSSTSSTTSSSEPHWVSIGGTSQNGGIILNQDSQILINATGTISLGPARNPDPAHLEPAQIPDIGSNNSTEVHSSLNKIKVANEEVFTLDFNGTFSNPTKAFLSGSYNASNTQNQINNELNFNNESYANGAKAIFGYFIPFPPDYHKYQDKFPLFPNPKAWNCYSSSEKYHLDCSSGDDDDYDRAENASFSGAIKDEFNKLFSDYYKINNSNADTKLIKNTGFIRNKDDGLLGVYELVAKSLDNPNYKNIDNLLALSDPSPSITYAPIPYPAPLDYQVKFIKTDTCGGLNFKYAIENSTSQMNDSTSNIVFIIKNNATGAITSSNAQINSATTIDISKNDISKFYIKLSTPATIPANCEITAVFLPYHDIKFDASGFINFGVVDSELNNTVANNCKLIFNIINPENSSKEYVNYNNHAIETQLGVNNPQKYFIRKGQVLRFASASWNGEWKPKNGTVNKACGVGFYVKQTPRPAVFCSKLQLQEYINLNQDTDATNDCAGDLYYDDSLKKHTACTENFADCGNIYTPSQSTPSTINDKFCPSECLPTKSYFNTNCRPSTSPTSDLPVYPTTNCAPTISPNCKVSCNPATDGAGCKNFTEYANFEPYKTIVGTDTARIVNIFNQTNCSKCIAHLKTSATKSFYSATLKSTALNQCYDLEDYTGTLEELNDFIRTESAKVLSARLDPLKNQNFIDKKLKKLKTFDGNYGNLYPIQRVEEIGNIKNFSTNISSIAPNSGYVKFLLLDNSYSGDFNFTKAPSYTSSNLEISSRSESKKNNGKNLSVLLCKEASGSASSSCYGLQNEANIHRTFSGSSLGLISFDSAYSQFNNYSFNDLGYFYRITSLRNVQDNFGSRDAECQSSIPNYQNSPYIGANYLCFKDKNYQTPADNEKYRLSFKIIDNQAYNCNKASPNTPCTSTSSPACDGVKMENLSFDGTSSSTSFCRETEVNCTKKYYCVNKYQDNEGKYIVSVRTKKTESSLVSGFINSIISPILEIVDGGNGKENQIKRIYRTIANNAIYMSILNLSVVLMFSFYGLGFLMGVSELKQSEIIDRLIKVGLVYLFTNPSYGWSWFEMFFVRFFKDGTDFLTFTMASIFDDSGGINSIIASNSFYNKSPLFSSVDKVIQLFLINDVVHKKISALLFYNFYGIIYLMIIYYSAIMYVYAVSNAVLLYLTSQIFTSILFIVGPIFFIFILFKQTKSYFDNWINSIIGFSLQQIFLIFTLTLFNTIIYIIIKITLGYKVCWDSVWKISTLGGGTISLMSFWTLNDAPPYVGETVNISVSGEYNRSSPSIPMVLSLWTAITIMKTFIGTVTDLAATLAGGMQASTLGSGVAQMANNTLKEFSKKANKIYTKSGAQKMIRSVDKSVFGSGALAKRDRKLAKDKSSEDRKLKNQMQKDANKEMSKFKKENALEYSKMSEAQKTEKLMSIKKNTMEKTAKDAGKSPKEIRELMSGKGIKAVNTDNIFKAGLDIAKQSRLGGGTVMSSLNDRVANVDTGMSQKEMKDALKNMKDPNERKELVDSIKSGNIRESKDASLVDKMTGKAGNSVTNQERREAIKQLEDSGKISKQSATAGQGVLGKMRERIENNIRENRSPSEEAKINEQIKQNRIDKAFDSGSNMDSKDIAKIDSFAKYCNTKDGNKESLGDNKIVNKKDDSKKDEIQKEQKEQGVAKLEKSKADNDQKIDSAKENLNNSNAILASAKKDMSSDETHKKMDGLKNKIDSGKASVDEKKDFNQMLSKDRERTDGATNFETKASRIKEASAKVSEDKSELNKFESKGQQIDSALNRFKGDEVKQQDNPNKAARIEAFSKDGNE